LIFRRKKVDNKPDTLLHRVGNVTGNFKRYLTDEMETVLNGWRTGDTSIDATLARFHKKTVARAREEHRKNDYVKRYFQLLKTNVIGPEGIVLHALMTDGKGKRIKAKNLTLEKAWQQWMRKEYCDIQGKLNFVQMQQLILTSVAQDGEAIILLVNNPDNPFGLSLQLIDSARLDIEHNKKLSKNRYIRNSIEFNQYGKPLAYHLLDSDEEGVLNRKNYNRVPAEQIIHLYQTDFVGQNRGMSWIATALFRMKMLNSYQDAAIINANSTARKIAFFKKQYSDAADADKKQIFQDEHIGYGIIPDGYEMTSFDSQYPNGEIEPFTKSLLRGIASALGVSYNALASDLEGVNYSSLRQGAIDERDNYRTIQNWFINAFLMPLYTKWLESALLLNAIDGFAIADFDKAQQVRFQARRWQWVDPAKEMTAFEKKLNLGVTTRDDIIREMGDDPDHVFNQLSHEQEQLSEYGLTHLIHPTPTSNNKEIVNDDTKQD